MQIEKARYSDGELHLKCSPREGMALAVRFEAGDYELVKARKRRTLNANAYLWQLIGKIAAKLRLSDIEVYRKAIEDTGGMVSETICIREEAAASFIQAWERGHLGRMCRQWPSDTPGYVCLDVIYGSSDYDKSEMARLIDTVVQDAQALGIETMEPGKLESLLGSWKNPSTASRSPSPKAQAR